MPKAFFHSGYLVGSIGTIVIGSIAVYCIQMLLTAHYELCKRNKVRRMIQIHAFFKEMGFFEYYFGICAISGAEHGLSDNSQKCVARRSTMDAQICTLHRVMSWIRQTNQIQLSNFNRQFIFPIGRHVTNFFILIYQLGICCIYIVFIGENLKSITDHFTGTENDVRMFMVIILLPIIFINWVS